MNETVEVRVGPDGLCYVNRDSLICAVFEMGVRKKDYKDLGMLVEWFIRQFTKYGNPPDDEEQTGKLEISYNTGVETKLRYYYSKDGLFYSIDDLRLLLAQVSETETQEETIQSFVLL